MFMSETKEFCILGQNKQYAPFTILEDEGFQRSRVGQTEGIWEQMKEDGGKEMWLCGGELIAGFLLSSMRHLAAYSPEAIQVCVWSQL